MKVLAHVLGKEIGAVQQPRRGHVWIGCIEILAKIKPLLEIRHS